jgi:hypothetical protein
LDFRLTLLDAQTIPVTTVRPHLGGKRYWFLCGCGRRVGRLYLPTGERVFGCRHCYNLTYRSSQEHDPRTGPLVRNPDALIAALSKRGEDWKQAFLGVRAFGVLYGLWARRQPRCIQVWGLPKIASRSR